MPSRASIIIPAHNEESRIRGLLEALSDPSIRGLYDVYVVCNGCTDRTRQVAEEYAGIVVVEIEKAGKHHALNEGDRLAGDVYPRLYCDADVRIAPSSIELLVAALTTDDVKVAGPVIRYGLDESTWAVTMFFRALESPVIAPWLSEHLVGRGLYGASRAARHRFTSFPSLFADDLFFDSQYDTTEKVMPPGAIATLWVPVRLRPLIRGEVRVAQGNWQYRISEGSNDLAPHGVTRRERIDPRPRHRFTTLKGWVRDVRGRDVVPLLVYLGILTTARTILTTRKWRGVQIKWR